MITALYLGNFKAFADTQRIPIKPLTLIFGPNSSGKSSIIHSLLLAQHAMETGNLDVHQTKVAGEAVDLGGFRQFVHRQRALDRVKWGVEAEALFANRQRVRISATMEFGLLAVKKPFEYDAFDSETGKLKPVSDVTDDQIGVGRPFVQGFELTVDGRPLLRLRQGGFTDSALLEFLKAAQEDFASSYRKLMKSKADNKLVVDFLDRQHPFLDTLFDEALAGLSKRMPVAREQFAEFRKAVCERLSAESRFRRGRFFPEDEKVLEEAYPSHIEGWFDEGYPNPFGLTNFWNLTPSGRGYLAVFIDKISFQRAGDGPMDLPPRESAVDAVTESLQKELGKLVFDLQRYAEVELRCFEYLSPLRSYPPRHFFFNKQDTPIRQASGSHAWDVLCKDAAVREKVNRWLGDPSKLSTPYELRVRHLTTIADLEGPYLEAIAQIEKNHDEIVEKGCLYAEIEGVLGKLKSHEGDLHCISELYLADKRNDARVTHRDIGVGISQILPILVAAHGTKKTFHAIEQPESQVHPALQAELGDVFIESALGENKNTFLLETHSEHLILRIMRRMRETFEGKLPSGRPAVRPQDVCILYVEPDGSRSIVREMPLNERGELVKAWPNGFFEEGLREVFGSAEEGGHA